MNIFNKSENGLVIEASPFVHLFDKANEISAHKSQLVLALWNPHGFHP